MQTLRGSITIPHRDSRTFAHGADIYRASLEFLHTFAKDQKIQHLRFSLRRPLGSRVNAELAPGRASGKNAAVTVDFDLGSSPFHLSLANRSQELEFAETYHFDENIVRESLQEKDGAFCFKSRIHPSNIHMLLAPIKLVLPFWPAKSEQARIVKMTFENDIQSVPWNEISLRVHPHATTFNITKVYRGTGLIGEVIHYFLGGEQE